VLATAVIGAGPAGLLFSLIGRITMGDTWQLQLFDKRDTYVRTHRLRMAPEPYLAIQRALNAPRFDALIAFLHEHDFSPEVNLLEAKLTDLLAGLGVRRIVREITTIRDLRVDTIVGADSVHSTVRELVRGDVPLEKRTHERLARLRVTGADLPPRLGVVDQYRLSKVLGSFVDYRLNANGFAEIDLFLSEEEHAIAQALGASPKEPVELTARTFERKKAPFMRALVEHLEGRGLRLVLHSTFLLEHAVMPRVSFESEGRKVFLLGDAAASLPFFRGMACLGGCAHALARAHASRNFDEYDREVAGIVRLEVAVVRSRAQIIRGLRELIRISSLLPFPIQSWWLSAALDPLPDRVSPGVHFNLLIAATAAGLMMLGLISPWLALLSLPVQIGGGVAYRWTLDLEPGPHRYLRRLWEVQIAAIAALGVTRSLLGRMSGWAMVWWWILGAAFVVGIYGFEWFVARRLRHADLREPGNAG
jgi:2-polyprenyl-6-methoxyphenol hydroxylase-like FAD-dependent oxidoreductase